MIIMKGFAFKNTYLTPKAFLSYDIVLLVCDYPKSVILTALLI